MGRSEPMTKKTSNWESIVAFISLYRKSYLPVRMPIIVLCTTSITGVLSELEKLLEETQYELQDRVRSIRQDAQSCPFALPIDFSMQSIVAFISLHRKSYVPVRMPIIVL